MPSTRCCWRWNTVAAPAKVCLVEAAMVDAALNIAAEQVIEYSAYGALLERAGNRGPTAAPQNLYRTADIDEFGRLDSWVAIAVANRRAVGRPARRARKPLLGNGSRAGRRPGGGNSTTSSTSSWPRGVRTAAATRSSRALGCRRAGGQGDAAASPDGNGAAEIPRLLRRRRPPGERPRPAQHRADEVLRRARRVSTQPAPLLGQHNHELLAELGLTAARSPSWKPRCHRPGADDVLSDLRTVTHQGN